VFVVSLIAAGGGCIDDALTTNEDVIPELTVTAKAGGALVADGVSLATVHVCTVDNEGRDPALEATLRASAGTWVLEDSDNAKQRTLSLADRCADATLRAGTHAGTVVVEATVGDFMRVKEETYTAAAIMDARANIEGVLDEGTTMLDVSVDIEVPGLGQVSAGTEVDFSVTPEPAGGIAYFSRKVITLDSGNTADATLFVAETVTSVSVSATITPPGGAPFTGTVPATIERP
jgi:hypothetical protein